MSNKSNLKLISINTLIFIVCGFYFLNVMALNEIRENKSDEVKICTSLQYNMNLIWLTKGIVLQRPTYFLQERARDFMTVCNQKWVHSNVMPEGKHQTPKDDSIINP